MKKRIFKDIVWISAIGIILSSVFSLMFYFKNYQKTSKEYLTGVISIIDSTINYEPDKIAYLGRTSSFYENISVVCVDEDRNILFNSEEGNSNIIKFIESERFEDSIKTGVYNPDTYRENILKDVYYNAFKLRDGDVLLVSTEMDSIIGLFVKVFPVLLLIMLVVIIAGNTISWKTSDGLITLMLSDIKDDGTGEINVQEISPILQELKSQRQTIVKQLEEKRIDENTIQIILENMEEGFMMTDGQRNVLMVNRAALRLLDALDSVIDKNVLYLTRNEDILNAIFEALEGNPTEGIIVLNEKYIKYYSNPVYIEDNLVGSVLFLIDQTKQIESQKIREEFSANVSHELKTPLTSIYGFAELLMNDIITAEEDKKEVIEDIYIESKRLLNLTDDIMKISRLEGQETLVKEEVNLREIADEVANSFEKIAKSKDIVINVEGEATLFANETMIWELFRNLTENALKYNSGGGSVDISLTSGKDVEIIFRDMGIGIPKEKLGRIFERFYRVDESRNKKRGGTGLGLSIVKHVVKRHNGEIYIDSELGIGTTIGIVLPIEEGE